MLTPDTSSDSFSSGSASNGLHGDIFSGSGMVSSGSGIVPDQITCQSQLETETITFEAFDSVEFIFRTLAARCSSTNQDITPTFSITLQDQTVLMSSQQLEETLLIEHLSIGNNSISVMVCGLTCEQATMLDVVVSVEPSTRRLFPYGYSTGDDSFSRVLDGSVPIYPSHSIPFFSNYYKRLYVS